MSLNEALGPVATVASDRSVQSKHITMTKQQNRADIPVWEKYTLTIDEAAAYFRVGENKLRKLVGENRDADYVIWNGNRPQIKRKLFERYIDRCNII